MTQEPPLPLALIVAGPTASGKSALALELAEILGGVVINADSMQVYRELRILTARPTPAEEARVPHALFGVRSAADPASAGWWRREALAAMDKAREALRVPILCGGTGLYLTALVEGLAELPPVPEDFRKEAKALLAALGPVGLHAKLAAVDPDTAARLHPTDSQRITRAWEVWRGTGRGLAAWQARAAAVPAPWRFVAILLNPPRPSLHAAITARFAGMLRAGAVEEVQALLALGLDPSLPAMRAHGVAELSAFLSGRVSLAEAARRTVLATCQYAKRQVTWFRHHHLGSKVYNIDARFAQDQQNSRRMLADLLNFLRQSG